MKSTILILLILILILIPTVSVSSDRDKYSITRHDDTISYKGSFIANETVSMIELNMYMSGASKLKLSSNGGDAIAGVEVSEWLLNKNNVTVIVDDVCLSACFVAFVGGKHRIVYDGARLGHHGPGFIKDRALVITISSEQYQRDTQSLRDVTAKIMDVMYRSGVDLDLILFSMLTPLTTMNYIDDKLDYEQAMRDGIIDEIIFRKGVQHEHF